MVNKPRKLKVDIDVKQLAELIKIMGDNVVLQLNIAGHTTSNEQEITEFASCDPNSDLQTKSKRYLAQVPASVQPKENNDVPKEEVKEEIKEEEVKTYKRGLYIKARRKTTSRKNQELLRRRLDIARPNGKLDVSKAKAVKLTECGLLDSGIVEDLATLGITNLQQLLVSNAEELTAKSSGKPVDGKVSGPDLMYNTILINTIRRQLKQIGVHFKKRKYHYGN